MNIFAHRVSSGTDRGDTGIDTLKRFGWWNEDSNGFISTLIFSICLANKNFTLPLVEMKKLTLE